VNMHAINIPYQDEGIELEGFVAYPKEEKRPVVILCHAWKGRDNFICEKAKAIAEWGYVGFALDM
jgi:dienelactone hydrolase